MSKQIKTLRDHNGFDVPVTAIGKIDLKKNQTAIKTEIVVFVGFSTAISVF